MDNLNLLFTKISEISKRYEEIARVTGANFNIFKTLHVERYEVKTHSAFLSELLNAKGSHGQGGKYLDLFIQQFGVKDFDSKNSESIVEYSIGQKFSEEQSEDEQSSGRIDILITDKDNNCIVIENKIDARDQGRQLIRYQKFIKEKQRKGYLFYLNLDSKEPHEKSRGDLKNGDYAANENDSVDFQIISYKWDILEWLEQCLKESASLPLLRETLQQYIQLIKSITNHPTNKSMEQEIVKYIIESTENLKTASTIASCIDAAKQKILQKFWKELYTGLKNKFDVRGMIDGFQTEDYYALGRGKIIALWVEIPSKRIGDYRLYWGAEIEHNFYSGFWIGNKDGKKESVTNNDICQKYREYLQEYKFANDFWLGWKYSIPQLNFKNFNDAAYELADDVSMKKIVTGIVENAYTEIERIKGIDIS